MRLTTFEVCFPRIVLAEFNTHRVFSRNSASSRAIPIAKQLGKIDLMSLPKPESGEPDPFFPFYWGKNQKGMSAEEELGPKHIEKATRVWGWALDSAVFAAKQLLEIGVHKQITNRLLEPFMWHTVIVTSTYWTNYENLRDSRHAQPEIKKSASMLKKLRAVSQPQILANGQWHLPLVTNVDEATLRQEGYFEEDLVKISAARCARVSYLTHNGVRDPKEDLRKYDELLENRHMSPFEHPAQALSDEQWKAYAESLFVEFMENQTPMGNYFGWKQLRKTLPGEDVAPADAA